MKQTNKLRVIQFLIGCSAASMIVFTTGCIVWHPGYPESWPQIKRSVDESRPVERHGCPDISGHYGCWGANPNQKQIRLEVAFLRTYLCKDAWADSMEVLNDTDSSLLLRGFRGDSVCGEKTLVYEKDYLCTDEGLEISGPTETDTEYEALGISTEKKTRTFLKANDGSLILNDSFSGVGVSGLLLFIPVAASTSEWYRFEAIAPVQQKDGEE